MDGTVKEGDVAKCGNPTIYGGYKSIYMPDIVGYSHFTTSPLDGKGMLQNQIASKIQLEK